VLVTPPVSIQGMGESQIKPSRRLGHHSQQILTEYGYSAKDIDVMSGGRSYFTRLTISLFKLFAVLVVEC
jgi:hypothetical protein